MQTLTTALAMNRSFELKLNKVIQLNCIQDKVDLSRSLQNSLFSTCRTHVLSSAHVTFSRLHHTVIHTLNLNKVFKMKVIFSPISDHNIINLDMNNKSFKTYTIGVMLYNNFWQLVDPWRNQQGNLKLLNQLKMETEHSKDNRRIWGHLQ